MGIISEKPAPSASASAAASSRKPGTHFQCLRQLFTRNRKNKDLYPRDAYNKYEKWENKGFTFEMKVGCTTCTGCKSKINITREVQRKGAEKAIDNLRFEQEIEGGTGRLVKTFPTSFEEEFEEFKKCRTEKLEGEERTGYDGKKYELLWEKDYAVVECINCNREIQFVNHVRRDIGEQQVKWFLTYKV